MMNGKLAKWKRERETAINLFFAKKQVNVNKNYETE